MSPRLLLALSVAAAFVSGCGGGSGDDGGGKPFTNPVYAQDFPDPFVLRAGDTYHAYATTDGEHEVQTLTSRDLVTWAEGPDALPEVGTWAYPGKTWAPEVLALDDSYVLYYTANGGSQCVGRAVADSPEGPFVDRWDEPLVCQRTEGGSIDASPFRDGDGALYLYWKNDGNAFGQTTYVYVQRLSDDGTELVGEPRRIAENDVGWEGGVVEGPQMWKEGDRYYLFFSGNAYDSDFYAVGYATCEGPLGPCRDAPENPILETACAALGPGHHTLVRHGDATWIVYHAWVADRSKRVLWLDRLEWRDGKPVVDGPTCEAQPGP